MHSEFVFRRLQRPFFCQRGISLRIRMTVFDVMVLSVLLYGCETWADGGAASSFLVVAPWVPEANLRLTAA